MNKPPKELVIKIREFLDDNTINLHDLSEGQLLNLIKFLGRPYKPEKDI